MRHVIKSTQRRRIAFWLMVLEVLVHGHLAPLIVGWGNTELCGREHGGAKLLTPSHVRSTRCTLQDHTQEFVLCILYSSPFLCWAYNPFMIRNSRVSVKKLVGNISHSMHSKQGLNMLLMGTAATRQKSCALSLSYSKLCLIWQGAGHTPDRLVKVRSAGEDG